MFKLESYLTPYISAYLARYVKDLNTDDFQVSFWQGGATFCNVNLNLEALESELKLPAVTLVSGHIHELKINVPWTKITSEPITVNVNTIEIVLKLRGPNDPPPPRKSNLCEKRILSSAKGQEPPGYIQSLTNKVLQNVEFVFQNVVLKYTEDDIVLSLNIRKAALKCVDRTWTPAFIELTAPEFILRKCWTCSDLTICLDKTNNVGKIETYMEPFLYKCSFDVRVLYQYHGLFAKLPYFARYDFYLAHMNFSINDEQIPMIVRLYNLVNLLASIDNYGGQAEGLSPNSSDESVNEENQGDDSVMGWASWAVSWVPAIPEAIFGPMDESADPLPECEFSAPVVHYGVYVERATVIFKSTERIIDRMYKYQKPAKIRFIPFLKCELQGSAFDLIYRGVDLTCKIGVSELILSSIGTCPCGLPDFDKVVELSERIDPVFLQVGEVHHAFACLSLFNPDMSELGDVRPPVNYNFKSEGYVEDYTEEKMLDRTPGIAIDMIDCYPDSPSSNGEDSESAKNDVPCTKMSFCLSRLVVAPMKVQVRSSSIHRIKLVCYSAAQYTDTQYDHLKELAYPKNRQKRDPSDCNIGKSLFTFQFTVLKPRIIIYAADHPDYDRFSHLRALRKQRSRTNKEPSSHVHEAWPTLLIICDTVDGKTTQPAWEYRRLVESYDGDGIDDYDVVSSYLYTFSVFVVNLELHVTSGQFHAQLIEPLNITASYQDHMRPELLLSEYESVHHFEVGSDSIRMKLSKPNLMLFHIIVASCWEESYSQHLINTTLLEDLPNYRNGEIEFDITSCSFMYSLTNTVTSIRLFINSFAIFVTSPEFAHCAQLFQAPLLEDLDTGANHDDRRSFVKLFIQCPTKLLDDKYESTPEDVDQGSAAKLATPIFALDVGSFKVEFDLLLADWLTYTPKIHINSTESISEVRMSSHSMYPVTPLSNTRLDHPRYRNIEVDAQEIDSHSSVSLGSQSESFTGLTEMYKSQASTHRTDLSRSLSFKSTKAESLLGFDKSLNDQFETYDPHIYVYNWEAWLVTHLAIVKKTYINIEAEPAQLVFPVGDASKLVSADESIKIDYFVIQTPRISAHPEIETTNFIETYFYQKKPVDAQRNTLYPLRILLNNVTSYSTHGSKDRVQILPPFSLGLTLTLSEKKSENTYPAIAACIHCDVPPLKIVVCSLQIKLFAQLVEKALHTASIFLKSRPSLLLKKVESSDYMLAVQKLGNLAEILNEWPGPRQLSSQSSFYESVDLTVNTSELLKTVTVKPKAPKDTSDNRRASLWIQFTLTQFQLILRNGETRHSSDVTNQLVLEIEDIVSSIDVQSVFMKLALKVGALSLRSYERNEEGLWDFGKHMGVVISSSEEITRDIDILGSTINAETNKDEEEPAPSSTKKHGFLYFTFTRVLASNFHKKAELVTPNAKWYSLLQKHYKIDAKEDGKKKMLNEFDIKMKSLDILLCPETFLPFRSIFYYLLTMDIPSGLLPAEQTESMTQIEVPYIPLANNNSLPLIYLETEMIRIFIKTNRSADEIGSLHDVALVQIDSVSMASQTENPLHRTIIKPELYLLAEQAGILSVPGSAIEDRQYQMDIHDFSVVSCNWKDVETKSKRIHKNRSSVLLRAMGENPAFEWNRMQNDEETNAEVEAHLLLERIDISVALAPPIVCEKNPISPKYSVLITGQAFELNVPSQLSVSLNNNQVSCLNNVVDECQDFWAQCKTSPEGKSSSSIMIMVEGAELTDIQEQIRTLLKPKTDVSVQSSTTDIDSGIDSIRKNTTAIVPTDILITCSFIELKLYELTASDEVPGNSSSANSKMFSLKPLLYLSLTQPHWVTHLTTLKQNMEISAFDVWIGVGSQTLTTTSDFLLPQVGDFMLELVKSISGNKNPKTGMTDPYFTFKLTDFLLSDCKASIEIFRPVELSVSPEAVDKIILAIMIFGSLGASRENYYYRTNDDTSSTRNVFSSLSCFAVNLNQVVFNVVVFPNELPNASVSIATSNVNLTVKSNPKSATSPADLPERIMVGCAASGIMITSSLQDRSDTIMNPVNVKLEASFQWHTWYRAPIVSINIVVDPVTFYLGSNNILSLLQIHHGFDNLRKITDGLSPEGSDIIETIGEPDIRFFNDDLSAGAFKYVLRAESCGLPDIYQICFCESQQSMTWRYPQPRFLTNVESCPVPFNSSEETLTNSRFLDCSISYWDEAQQQFLDLGIFKLSETTGMRVKIPLIDHAHNYVSSVWRITILTSFDAYANSSNVVKPELLATCIKVNSAFNPFYVQKLNIVVDIPRIVLRFVNHLDWVGQTPDERLALYSYCSFSNSDQEFATIQFSSTKLIWRWWHERCTFDWISYFNCSVVDYIFLTECALIEPFNFHAKIGWFEHTLFDIDFLAKPIVLKMGGTVLHTLVSSWLSWSQTLSCYNGQNVDVSRCQNMANVILTQIVLCNDTSSTLHILQDGTNFSTVLRTRQCLGFSWIPSKANGQCKVRLNDGTCWSKAFGLKNHGFIMRKVENLPLFINISQFSPSQIRVTISGGLIIANALNESINSLIIPRFNGGEINCVIGARSHSPSHVINPSEVKEFQFKLSNEDDQDTQWSAPVTLDEMIQSPNRSVALQLLYPGGKLGPPNTFNVWCSLVEETIEKSVRYLIVVCPFFRVKSSLAGPTIARVSTGKNEVEASSLLHGRDAEIQVDFFGSQEATLHLTFQHCLNSTNSHSTPTIPLNPNGPALEKNVLSRPIDEILNQILVTSKKENVWPYIREELPLRDWVLTEVQPEVEVKVEFSLWIQGLPSVLIDAKPRSLFVNTTGKTILFADNCDEKTYLIPNCCVFSPSKIEESFKIGVEIEGRHHWSKYLEFTEQKSRTEIHYVNSNSKIPIDCFSRMEIFGENEICFITMETRMHKGILVLAIRPTFSIQNRTEASLEVKPLSLTPSIIPPEADLALEHNSLKLNTDINGSNRATSEPLLLFHTVSGRSPNSSNAENENKDRIKYLALRCNSGPYWFIQLTDFSRIFDSMSTSQSIPGRRIALSLQNCQPEGTGGTSTERLKEVTYPATLSWACKDGQVWISISPDDSPQILFFNKSNAKFLIAESSSIPRVPLKDNDHFMQFLMIPAFSMGHYSLPSFRDIFPDLKQADPVVSILLGKFNNLVHGAHQSTSIYFEPSQLEWSNDISLSKLNITQSFRVGDYNNVEHYQLLVEQLGLTYYVYIQEMPATEITAKDVRGRIAETCSSSSLTKPLAALHPNTVSPSPSLENADQEIKPPQLAKSSKWRRNKTNRTFHTRPIFPTPRVRVFLPQVRLILTDDISITRHKCEMLGVTLQDLCVDLTPQTSMNFMQTLQDRPEENTIVNIRLGDVQIDNALYEEQKYDFAVIIKREGEYKSTIFKQKLPFVTLDETFRCISDKTQFLMEFTGLIALDSTTQRSLQKVWVKFQPFAVYLEDTFLYFIQPVFQGLSKIVYDRLSELEANQSAAIPNSSSMVGICSSPVGNKPSSTNLGNSSTLGGHSKTDTRESVISSKTNVKDPSSTPTLKHLVEEEDINIVSESVLTQTQPLPTGRIQMPPEILSIFNEFSNPIRMQLIDISPGTVYLTLRLSSPMYLAVDRSPLELSRFEARTVVTTYVAIGQALSVHYLQGAIYGANPVRLLGSLELIGSPGTLARSFGSGLKDFVVYPIRGLFEGPAGFITGLTYGCSSLLTNVGSGTLTSVTNLAWSVSRNLDRLTLNQEEQLQREEDRRVPIDGVTDGIRHGLTGFGIRLLGAIGGLAQHPIESVIETGVSPFGLFAGFTRGLLGVVTKPFGGAAELVAMTGQGILTGAGWTPKLQRKHKRVSECVDSCCNSSLKYQWMVARARDDEVGRILLLFDASRLESASSTPESTPVSILLSAENIYIINTELDEVTHEFEISSVIVEKTNDNSVLSLRPAPPKKNESTSLAEERLIDFVQGFSHQSPSSSSLHAIHESKELIEEPSTSSSMELTTTQSQNSCNFDFYVDPNTKCEFITLLKQAQEQQTGRIFKLF